MTEFSKIKIPFAIALLAAMFTIKPIIDSYSKTSYIIFDLPITVGFIYVIFCSLLGASVYFYAVGLVGEKPIFELSNKVGHITYALALITPPLFLLLYPVTLIATFAINFWHTPFVSKTIETSFSVLLGVGASIISNLIIKAFSQRDKSDKIDRLTDQENNLLSRAKQLFQQGYYDLAAAESWKAIEVALSKLFVSMGRKDRPRTMQSLIEVAQSNKILNSNQIEELMSIRKTRNEAVHTDKRVTRDEALNSLNVSEKIITSLQKAGDSCYFCGRFFAAPNLESDDITGASACKDCSNKHPTWKEDLMAMGRDT